MLSFDILNCMFQVKSILHEEIFDSIKLQKGQIVYWH